MIVAKWFVYILEGQDGTYYSGITWRDRLCLGEQAKGLGRDYVYRHGLKQVTQVEEYSDLKEAQRREFELRKELTDCT